jgi:hypothetical protein
VLKASVLVSALVLFSFLLNSTTYNNIYEVETFAKKEEKERWRRKRSDALPLHQEEIS